MGDGDSGGDTPQVGSQAQLQHRTGKQERSDKLDFEQYSSDSTVGNKTECILITHIRATDVTIGLRRIPVGFYVAVNGDNVTKRTSNKPLSAGKDAVEWVDEIVLPPDRLSRISFTVFASFELGLTLGAGEVVRRFEITIGELLDRAGRLKVVRFLEQSDESFEIEIERRDSGRYEYTTTSNPPESEETSQLRDLTDRGHHALTRYREHEEPRDLEESIGHFERVRELCPADHPCRDAVLFNLATAKLIECRVNDVSPDLDVPIDLYRAALGFRPRGHPDHPFTLLSLGIALKARFQRQQNEVDETEGETLLSQVLDVALEDSYVYLAAVLALGSIAESELIQRTEVAEIVERLDAAMQRIFDPDSCTPALLDHVGVLFCIQFKWLSYLADPEKAILVLEAVVRFASDNHPDKSSWLEDLGDSLLTRYERFDDVADLERSISMLEDAVQLTSGGHPERPSRLSKLGSSLSTRYEFTGDDADLERSISTFANAVESTPEGHPEKPVRLNDLGSSLTYRYQRFGDIEDLERSISMKENAMQLTPDDHPGKPTWLNNLGNSLLTRYQRIGDTVDLERSVSMFQDAVQFTPDGHPNKPSLLNNLGNSLSIRYEHIGDVTDLERSISILEDAVKFTPDGHADKPSWLNSLGNSLLTRYERIGDVEDLERSISIFQDALQLTLNGHPKKSSLLNGLGNSLLTRYERIGDIGDLEKSISMYTDALKLTPEDHPEKPVWLNNLGNSLSTRYEHVGDVVDLERSISMLEDAVRFTPDGHPDKPARLNNLGSSLSTRYERFGDIGDLERSISLKESAVQLTSNDHPDKSSFLNNLGNSLLTHYERFRDIVNLEISISLFKDALSFTPDGHPDRPARLNNLSNSLSTRYEHFGDVDNLEESISMIEEAVQFTPDGHADKPARLNNLGNLLLTRYERFGDVVDLGRSISTKEDAVQSTPDGHLNKPLWLNNLGISLSTRYQRTRDNVDLERAISMFEDAVRFTPDGHPDMPLRLSNLSNAMLVRYEHTRNLGDLEKLILMKEDAVRFTPDSHPDKRLRLNNLGNSLLARYECFGNVVDLQRSILLFEGVVQSTPDGHPDKSFHLRNLALSFLKRFQHPGGSSSSDLTRAILYASHAARSQTSPSLDRFQGAQHWIRCARLLQHDPQSLLDAYTVAIDLLPQLAWIGLSLHDRYHQLLQAADEVRDAAAAALDANRPELAVEWLEQGRSIMWSQLSQLRTPIDYIRSIYPDLAARFERVSHELEHASARDRAAVNKIASHSKMVGGPLEKQAQRHHELALSRDRLLAEIRALPGFERFLLPKTIDQLSPLAHSGPVVFLNASKHRCDALVVIAGQDRVIHVPLPDTSYDVIVDMQLRLNKLLKLRGRVASRDDSDRGAKLQGTTPDDVFGSILPYLWNKVVSPILEILRVALNLSTSCPKLPCVFWCPTGPFTFLPVHAAGIYDTANTGPKLSDFVISSYIPTMSALELLHQEDPEATSRGIRLLAVRQPSTDGQAHLTGVQKEVEVIQELMSSSPFVGFQEADGTVEDVLEKMAETDWVHFACHGTQDRTNPLESGLLLAHGKRLKLSDMVRLSRPRGGLAFLSACQTATGDEGLSEEAIHIAAGMLHAGYRGVIATMWTIMDRDAPRVAEDVYKSLFQDGKVPDSRQAAEVLHHAIKQLRDSGASFLSWVPFIHVGS